MAKARMLGQISKIEDQGDGTILVYGVASTPNRDSDGESFTADCMREAIPDYMAKRRALREMHQPIAAGVTTELFVDDDDATRITAHVVDPVSVKKVQAGVLKMFSIEGVVPKGGRDAKDKKVINKLKLREISLVDVGANEDANLEGYEVVKLDGEGEDVDPETVETPAVEPATDTVKKGLYGVSRFAELLQSLGYQASDAQYESDYEGDNSPLPAKLREWLATGAEILKAMTEEETAELLKSITPVQAVVIAQADTAKPGDDNVAKAGRTISAATRTKLDALKACIEKCNDAMKAFDDADDDADNDKPAAKIESPALSEDAIAKFKAEWEDSVSKVTIERDALKDEVAKLKGEATQHEAALDQIVKDMKAKGYLRVAEKGHEDRVDKAAGAEAESQSPLDAIKKVHASGPTIHARA
jgi:hypothetical protein